MDSVASLYSEPVAERHSPSEIKNIVRNRRFIMIVVFVVVGLIAVFAIIHATSTPTKSSHVESKGGAYFIPLQDLFSSVPPTFQLAPLTESQVREVSTTKRHALAVAEAETGIQPHTGWRIEVSEGSFTSVALSQSPNTAIENQPVFLVVFHLGRGAEHASQYDFIVVSAITGKFLTEDLS